MDKTNRRHSVMINRRFQITLIMKFIILNAAIMLIFGFFMYLFLDSEIQGSLHSVQITYKNLKTMLFPIVITLSALNIIFSSVLTAAYILLASFRIAGPMYRFNQALAEMSNGNLNPFTSIRRHDQFNDCSTTLETLSVTLSESFGRIRFIVDEMEKLSTISENSEVREKLNELKAVLDKYRLH